MWSAGVVLVCALDLLGRHAAALPPIEFVDQVPDDVSARAEAFVRRGTNAIFLVTSSAVFKRAARTGTRCGDYDAVRKIASVIVHEEQHLLYAADEATAYRAQLMALAALQAGPGTPTYDDVKRAMLATRERVARDTGSARATRVRSAVSQRDPRR